MSAVTLNDHEDLSDFYYEPEYLEEGFQDVVEHCVLPSAASILHIICKIILINIIFGLLTTIRLPHIVFHILSGLCGVYLVSNLESFEGKILILVYFVISYLVLLLSKYSRQSSQTSVIYKIKYLSTPNIIKYALIAILVLCEYFLLETETWMEVRGVVMILSMKLISLSEDIDKNAVAFPTFFRYFGYMFCGGNIMFGPWISFPEYILLFHQPTKKNLWWIWGIVRTLSISLLFLMISNCWSVFLIPDDSNVWLLSYREALSFRTSHYFISFLSEASMLSAGYKNSKIWHNSQKWRFEVVEPLKTEFPSGLAIVVTTWNKPMHDFLKKYIYRSWLPMGKFAGILATFVISSFLHGFELKVSVVLISIGIFSYIQFTVRDYLAKAFNCCIRVYPCKDNCTHALKRNSIIVLCLKFLFSCSSIIHLIYLGMIMDHNTDDIGIFEKWKRLYFISFWIMFVKILIII